MILIWAWGSALAQNPHGEGMKLECTACHNTDGWEISPDSWSFQQEKKKLYSKTTGQKIPQNEGQQKFNHFDTHFPLDGAHENVDCRLCHSTLVFSSAQSDCISCHLDVHSMSVGNDCIRCHDTDNWLVDDIPEIHEQNGFPLIGQHAGLSCIDCHQSETHLRFDRIGNDCVSCHLDDFNMTESPDHVEAGFSMNCIDCHSPDGNGWETDIVDHSFFPLTLGHNIQDCKACHLTNNFSDVSPDCISCHQSDFEATQNPAHELANFNTDCTQCHTTNPGWQPAAFLEHDIEHFPIYSGSHDGVWNDCAECHTNTSDYTQFDCLNCHINPETDNAHNGITGYQYENNACLACHPNGESDGAFDHDQTDFPLTGAHIGVDCLDCHENGFEGTSTNCVDCHQMDFDATINPNHQELNLPTDCASCHTTDPDWNPATFDIHDDFYPLVGAHAAIANDCAACHNGDYINTPNTCIGCHQNDYDNTMDPNHAAANFPTDCTDCHTVDAWTPATFDHDAQYFPIYSGEHEDVWSDCVDCHTDPNNFAVFSCINCHINPETDEEHEDVPGYVYEDNACLACHPTGDADMAFDHNETNFPLTGAHIGLDCLDCHENGFEGTSTNCVDCHQMDFNAAINPNHQELNLPTDCASCHTTDPDWNPATFDIHDDFYPLVGAHVAIANDCAACHNGDYINTPNTCIGCHQNDYDNTMDPNHAAANFPTDCTDCHTVDAWTPATFDHDAQYFPIYSGEHEDVWSDCVDCHTDPNNFAVFSCINCHINPETDEEHEDVPGYVYEDNACLACHPTGDADMAFDHNETGFPLTGAHIGLDCLDCHENGFEGTSTNCVDCHQMDFDAAINPNHQELNLPTDCASCHTTDPDWNPATFDIHDDFYPLVGAHAAIANDCAACHNGDYINTPNTCIGCHQDDYDNTMDPNHTAANFPTDCTDCHTVDAWTPATFDHDAQYFPIYSGEHEDVWSDCVDCHTDPNNFAVFSCTNCHINPETDEEHNGVSGYVYEDNACLACHPTGDADMAFDHNETNFLLTGAHIGLDCLDCHENGFEGTSTNCVDCHQMDFDAAINPNHQDLNIPTDCMNCHTTDPGWEPASFDIHDDYYPLTGAHAAIADNCVDCHNGDYTNTPNTCVGCHQSDYDSSSNPDHTEINIPTECINCHTTDPDWMPATFDIHDDYYPLTGAHAAIANDCAACHNGDYVNTPNTCIGCHQDDFDSTTDPDHQAANFPNDCTECHTTDAWEPSTFDHDAMYFPIYSGAHDGEWTTCMDCHLNPNNFAEFSCTNCHINPETDNDHDGVGGYVYEDNACLACHPTGEADEGIDHDATGFPLTGAHIGLDCIDCHENGFAGTSSACVDCHTVDFNGSTNPNHQDLGLSTDCATCHTTDPGWEPATFDVHDNYYPLTGAHAAISNDCVACHNGDYNNTPNTCVACHQSDYNASTNPNHVESNIPTDCMDCHTTNPGWSPATFDIHDDYYPLTGAHVTIANDCDGCHNGDYTNTPNTCVGCHQSDYNGSTNPNHSSLGIPTDCASCHTTDPDWNPATFDIHDDYYPLVGAHAAIANDCAVCHNGDYNDTPNTCFGCHSDDYNGTTNPDHVDTNFSTDCTQCHNENAWVPSTFDHDDFWPLNGAHALINNCNDCHNGDYMNTPNTCIGCHQMDYDGTNDPNHTSAGFPTDCLQCHNENTWTPSTFDHDGMYFPIYSGKHDDEWNTCADCHFNSNNYSQFDCLSCHFHDDPVETAELHEDVPAYQYESNACYACHPEGED